MRTSGGARAQQYPRMRPPIRRKHRCTPLHNDEAEGLRVWLEDFPALRNHRSSPISGESGSAAPDFPAARQTCGCRTDGMSLAAEETQAVLPLLPRAMGQVSLASITETN